MSEVELKAIIERAGVAAAKDPAKRMKGMESDVDRLANETKELNAPASRDRGPARWWFVAQRPEHRPFGIAKVRARAK